MKCVTRGRRMLSGYWAVLPLVFVLQTTAVAQTSQESDVVKELERFSDALEQEKNISPETKSSLKKLLSTLADEPLSVSSPATMQSTAMSKLADAAEKMAVHSDFRARHETDWRDTVDNRNRERVRFRLGASYEVDPGVSVEARLVTGNSDDPNSIHQTLGNVNDSFFFTLDRVNLKYSPEVAPSLELRVGKFGRTFKTNPVFGELAWDGDVQPEGVALSYKVDEAGPFSWLYLTAGEYLVLQQDRAEEATQFEVQGAAEAKLGDSVTFTAAVGWTKYQSITPDGSTTVLEDNAGNATVDIDGDGVADEFLSDFSILNPLAALTIDTGSVPLVLSAEYLLNFDARDNDTGWAVGAAIGRAKMANEWKLYYQWQIVEQDAVFSPFAQDDFIFITNYRTHAVGGKYKFTDHVELHVYGFFSEPESGTKTDEIRGRADLNVSLF